MHSEVERVAPIHGRLPDAVILTIGHSTRTIDDFIGLLRAHAVACVVDVRTVPCSRHNSQFNKDSLPTSLRNAHVGYLHMPGLGGLRHAERESVNTGWRNASFRGYADYMQTPEFEDNLQKLVELSKKDRIAVMCAEAVPWRCHRSLIGDALTVRGIRTEDIMSATRRQVHVLTPFAKVRGKTVTYPAEHSHQSKRKTLQNGEKRRSQWNHRAGDHVQDIEQRANPVRGNQPASRLVSARCPFFQ